MNMLDIDLPAMTARQVQKQNTAVAATANRVFAIGELEFYLRHSECLPQNPVRLQCLFLGQEITLIVDHSLVNTFLAPFALRLEDMSEDAISLFLLTHVAQLPKNLQILSMSLEAQDFYHYDASFEMISYTTGQSLNWHIAFCNDDKFPLHNLLDAMGAYLKGVMASVLSALPIEMPLVAAQIELPVDELAQLAVGDVLLIGPLQESKAS